MKIHALACLGWAVCAINLANPAQAQSPTPTDAPNTSVTGNLHLLSHYYFRGIDQTWGQAALQGGVDWSHASGWYAGAGLSNISPRSYPGGRAEIDLYGGYKGQITPDWGYSAGAYAYIYPGANMRHSRCPSAALGAPCGAVVKQSYNTLELNGSLSWKLLSYKLSYSASNYFGASRQTGYDRSSRGTLYHDVSLAIPLQEAWQLQLHAGHTRMRAQIGGMNPSYSDWRVALATSWADQWNGSIAAVGSSSHRLYRPPLGGLSATDTQSRALNRSAVVLQIGKTF